MIPKSKEEYSDHLREIVIRHFLNGGSEREKAKKVSILRDSVHCIIARYNLAKCIGNLMGRGQRRKTSTLTDHALQRKVKTNRRKSTASLKAELENELKVIISESTISLRFYEVGLYGPVTRKNLM